MNDDQFFNIGFSPLSPTEKLSNQKTDNPSQSLNDFNLDKILLSNAKMTRMKDYFDIDQEEYERLKLQLGVDFDTEQGSINQQVVNIFVKTLQQGLPLMWTRENDFNDNIVYYDKSTKITTYKHPLAQILRKNIKQYYSNIHENKEKILEAEDPNNIIIPEASKRQIDFQNKIKEKRRVSLLQNSKMSNGLNGTKIVMGSSTALKLFKQKMDQNNKPKNLIESITFKDTKSELRLRHLFKFSTDFSKQVYDTFYENNQEFNDIMVEAFYHYQKKFTNILSYQTMFPFKSKSDINQPDSSVDDNDDDLIPELPPYIMKNDFFRLISMEEQIALGVYYGIDPATEYYLLWIPRLALSMKLYKRWIKGYAIDNNPFIDKDLRTNKCYYKHVVRQVIIDFHPADPFIRYMVQIYQKAKQVSSQTHFKNFDMKGEDFINRQYEQKGIFCEVLGIENIIKHSIYVKLHQQQEQLNKNKVNITWQPQNEDKNQALSQVFNEEQDQYDNFTDAEIFAIASQCEIDLEKEIHLINYVVMIAAQVKAHYHVDLEFRYIKEVNQLSNIKNIKGRRHAPINEVQFYWRDLTNEKNHKVFPLLSEIRQRNQIFKQKHLLVEQYLSVLLEKGRIDPSVFKLDRSNKNGKGYFKVQQEDIERIFHLLGNKIKHQDIIDFCFQSPFRFEFTDAELEMHKKMLKELELEEQRWRQIKPQYNYDEISENDYDDSASNRKNKHLKRLGRGMSFTKSEDDDEDDLIKRIMRRKLRNDVDLDELASKHGISKRSSQNTSQNKFESETESPISERFTRQAARQTQKKKPAVQRVTRKIKFNTVQNSPSRHQIIEEDHQEQSPKTRVNQQEKNKLNTDLNNIKAKAGLRGALLRSKPNQNNQKALYSTKPKELKKSSQKPRKKDNDLINKNLKNLHSNEDFNSLDGNMKDSKSSKDIKALFKINDEKSLEKKLREVLQGISNLTKGITNLMKEPTGSNPLVNKLADIIFNTNIDPEDFIAEFEMLDENSEEDILHKLVQNIQHVHEKKQNRSNETLEEAQHLAENFFNMLLTTRRKKSSNKIEDIDVAHQPKDTFLEISKKMSIYDRLVKALFRMARNKVSQFDPENIQKLAEAQFSDDKRRSSTLFSNFVYIKNKKYLQQNEGPFDEQFKMLMQFQGQFNQLQQDYGIEDTRINGNGMYSLKRQNDLLSHQQMNRRQSQLEDYYRNKYQDLPEEVLQLKIIKNAQSGSWQEDSLTDSVSPKTPKKQENVTTSLAIDTLQELAQKNESVFKSSLRRQSLNDFVKKIDEDENEHLNHSGHNIKIPQVNMKLSGGIQDIINTLKIDPSQISHLEESKNVTNVDNKQNIEAFRKIIKTYFDDATFNTTAIKLVSQRLIRFIQKQRTISDLKI
eukprot:403375837